MVKTSQLLPSSIPNNSPLNTPLEVHYFLRIETIANKWHSQKIVEILYISLSRDNKYHIKALQKVDACR